MTLSFLPFMLSHIMCIQPTYGNCSVLLTINCCQYFFDLNWRRGIVWEVNPSHLSGISYVMFFNSFLVTLHTLGTFSAFCWSGIPINLSTVTRTFSWVVLVTLQHNILCIYLAIFLVCIIFPLSKLNLLHHFVTWYYEILLLSIKGCAVWSVILPDFKINVKLASM